MRILAISMISLFMLAGVAVADDVTPEPASPEIDCSVILFDEPEMKGDQVRLVGPLSQAKLADLEYSNGENLNEDVRGVKTGLHARVELYEKAEFADGKVWRIYESSNESLDADTIGEDSSALKITCLEIDVAAAEPKPEDCWVQLFDEPTLEGDKVSLTGPVNQAKLADLEYSNGENLNDDVRGVKTGPTARVELFDKADFGGQRHRVFPGSAVTVTENASSLKVTCAR